MALKIEVNCTRCKRTDSKPVAGLAEAGAFEDLQKRKAARLQEITTFLSGIPAEERPDFMSFSPEGVVVHAALCDPEGDESKRSCKKRVNELLKQAQEFEPRKPRSKKAE